MHAPEVRGPTLHAVLVPEHTVVPDCAQPPVPAEVHPPPVTRQKPPQLVWPAGHTQVPVPLQLPPLISVHAPEVRGPTLHAVVEPEHTIDPVWRQLGETPAEVHAAPVARQKPPQLLWPAGQPQAPLVQMPPVGEPQAVPLATLVHTAGGATFAAATQVWQVVAGLAWPLL